MVEQYITPKQFDDFINNQEVLIGVLNHSVTDIKESVAKSMKKFTILAKDVSNISVFLARLDERSKYTNRIVWGILGIIFTIVGAAVVSLIRGS